MVSTRSDSKNSENMKIGRFEPNARTGLTTHALTRPSDDVARYLLQKGGVRTVRQRVTVWAGTNLPGALSQPRWRSR